MFLVNYLNRNFTDEFFPLFEGIYAIELAIQLFSIVLSFPVIYALWSTKYFHRNIRLRLIFMVVNAMCAAIARIVIVAQQAFGSTQHVEVWYLIITSVFREYFKVYITGLASVLAVDRWIATMAWSWYESRVQSTIAVFIVEEVVECSIALSAAVLLICEFITDQEIMLIYLIQMAIGVLGYWLILSYNRREIAELKKGAQIETYSISRSFQLRENLAIMRMLSKVAGIVVVTTAPCFVLYLVYWRLPANRGLDTLRYLSVAFYDVWISISFLSIIVNLIRFEPKFHTTFTQLPIFARFHPKIGLVEEIDLFVNTRTFAIESIYFSEQKEANSISEVNLYFSKLASDWESGPQLERSLPIASKNGRDKTVYSVP